jgi:ABC-type sulfate transport system permease component
MSKVLIRSICVFGAVFAMAGVVYAAGATAPVAQTEAVTAAAAGVTPAISTMLIVGVGSVCMLVSRMLPRRQA